MMADFYYSARDILDEAMGTDAYFQIKSILTGMKAADVVEVRHGRWIFKEYDEMPWCTQAICSECGAVVENNSSLTTESGEKYFLKDNQYCRKCGALMDKEDEHEAD